MSATTEHQGAQPVMAGTEVLPLFLLALCYGGAYAFFMLVLLHIHGYL